MQCVIISAAVAVDTFYHLSLHISFLLLLLDFLDLQTILIQESATIFPVLFFFFSFSFLWLYLLNYLIKISFLFLIINKKHLAYEFALCTALTSPPQTFI